MKKLFCVLIIYCLNGYAFALPSSYTKLLPYVQRAPDQGETNTCWFVASTGAMELLLNKQNKIKNPKVNGKYDLSESFLIWQKDPVGETTESFLEEVVLRFNLGEAITNKAWPFHAYQEDGSDDFSVWDKHPDFYELPRIKVPPVKTTVLFSHHNRWATDVLEEKDLTLMKKHLSEKHAPLIVNYNDDSFWHVVLIVGYDDQKKGDCYDIPASECLKKGAFYVRDSDGKKYEARSYSWFLKQGNSAVQVELK